MVLEVISTNTLEKTSIDGNNDAPTMDNVLANGNDDASFRATLDVHQLEADLDGHKLAILNNQADVVQFRMNVLMAMMDFRNLSRQREVPKQEGQEQQNFEQKLRDQVDVDSTEDGSILSIEDKSCTCPPMTEVPLKRELSARKSSFLKKRRKTDPSTPETVRKVKFITVIRRSPEFRWAAIPLKR